MPILARAEGLFGPVTIEDSRLRRRMVLCGTVQGAAFHRPSASRCYPSSRPGPGPVPDAPYQLGWLIPAVVTPTARCLMIGLGAGTGAVSLLHHFSEIDLDVLEIDPVVISLARRFFPLLGYFERLGRLRLIQGDAIEHLSRRLRPYDLAMVDVTIDTRKPSNADRFGSLAVRVARAAAEVWLNVAGALGHPELHEVIRHFDVAKRPIQRLFSPEPLTSWLPVCRNWLLTTAETYLVCQREFRPFADLEDPGAETARESYRSLVGNTLSRAEADSHSPSPSHRNEPTERRGA